MARTPFLSRLQQLYLDFEESAATGTPVRDIQDARAARASRRDFLKTAAASAAVAMAWRARPLAAQPRIAVIGAGISGLTAALTLRDAGYACTVYEASSRVGGRMHSDTTSWLNNQVSERCGELIDTTHKTILGLAKRFNIPAADLAAAEPSQSSETYYFDGQYYTRDDANLDFNEVWKAVKKDLIDASYPTLFNAFTPAGQALDQMSVYDWIETRVPGGHTSPMGQLLDVAYNIEYGLETTQQSALNLVYLLAYQSQPGNFRIFGRSDERYHLVGGNERLPKAIADSLPSGTVQTGMSLTKITANSNGTVTLKFSNNATVTADRVILTIPFSVLRTLNFSQAGFNTTKLLAINQLGYGTNAKMSLQFSSRLWNTPGPWGVSNGSTYADTGYQCSWDVTRSQPGDTGILVDYTGGSIGDSFTGVTSASAIHARAIQFLSQLEPVFPNITPLWNGRVTLDTPISNPYALGSYSCWKVGQYTLFSGIERERAGKIHFGGEHCSTNFQGFMEGGAAEGARAANEILDDYKHGIFP